jgi:hypothetical protein
MWARFQGGDACVTLHATLLTHEPINDLKHLADRTPEAGRCRPGGAPHFGEARQAK